MFVNYYYYYYYESQKYINKEKAHLCVNRSINWFTIMSFIVNPFGINL